MATRVCQRREYSDRIASRLLPVVTSTWPSAVVLPKVGLDMHRPHAYSPPAAASHRPITHQPSATANDLVLKKKDPLFTHTQSNPTAESLPCQTPIWRVPGRSVILCRTSTRCIMPWRGCDQQVRRAVQPLGWAWIPLTIRIDHPLFALAFFASDIRLLCS